ncbi:MAG TPA: hypothetical protein VK846_10875, partial [Candidatus Limnocylindria bacterium]|nr:hypothetical protein [Candidatus Limnocylindria bacterium]
AAQPAQSIGCIEALTRRELGVIARAKSTAPDDPFFDRVAEVMKKEGINEEMARSYVLRTEPDLWVKHLYLMLGIDEEQAKRLGIKFAVEASARTVTSQTEDSIAAAFREFLQPCA